MGWIILLGVLHLPQNSQNFQQENNIITVSQKKQLTIFPRVQMGSESIAHEAEGRMGY